MLNIWKIVKANNNNANEKLEKIAKKTEQHTAGLLMQICLQRFITFCSQLFGSKYDIVRYAFKFS